MPKKVATMCTLSAVHLIKQQIIFTSIFTVGLFFFMLTYSVTLNTYKHYNKSSDVTIYKFWPQTGNQTFVER